MVLQFALFHIILILWPLYPLVSAQYGINTAQPGCDSFCGDVEIPYPFGMKDPKCNAEKWFEIECRNYSSNDQKPFLKSINLEVKEIYENDGIVSIMNPIYRWNCKSKDAKPRIDMKGSPFVYSQEQNKLLGVGCNNLALLVSNGSEIGGCVSICDNNEESLSNNDLGRDGCLRRYCCETSLPIYLSEYNVTIEDIGRNTSASDECNYAVIADESWLEDYYYMAIRSLSDLKDLLLQQGLSSGEVNFDKTKLFSSKDLEKATERFNVNRILGKVGQGTVYQGMLVDGQIVAVKKFKVHGNVEEFINEVVILSQINHRNVVKLFGFCLETQVLLLVYEFIPNGNLFQYLHDQNDELPMTWEMLLRIATEVAGALFYLHSAASQPIYHRDIKSTNILLDEKYRAKVADFGTSRMVSIEDTHLTTLVQGTFGYLDPEYFHTSQFTEKSDVYSFGVVLVELLTGQKPISSIRPEEAKSLASYFIMSMEEDHLFDILDPRIMKGGEKEDIVAVAKLAKRCLELNGRKRPSMKEVTMELERIQKLGRKSNTQQNHEEIDLDGIEAYQAWAADSTSTGRTRKSRTSSSSRIFPSILIK